MFFRAISLFKLLNAFLASISRILSVRPSIKRRQGAWIACSMPFFCQRRICTFPPSNWRSRLTHFTILLPIIRLKTSPMPVGRTPGHLSSAIRQALQEFKKFSSSVAILIASLDTALQRSIEGDLYDVKSRLHPPASKPDGPWLPFVFIKARFISDPLIFSKTEGWNGKSRFFRSVTT